jgi:hypothetical protein
MRARVVWRSIDRRNTQLVTVNPVVPQNIGPDEQKQSPWLPSPK